MVLVTYFSRVPLFLAGGIFSTWFLVMTSQIYTNLGQKFMPSSEINVKEKCHCVKKVALA